jgi:WD40 repeat protein
MPDESQAGRTPATQDDEPGTLPLAPTTLLSADAQLPTVPFTAYTVDKEIGRGGLGRISRAVDTRLGRTVAVKELQRATTHAEARFVREALITARLEHPAIVPVHEAGRWPTGQPFYAMKLVSGQTLAQLIRATDSLPARLALLPSVIAVAEAMAYAHSKGVIHRDLKPANVIVGQFGETVVVDWGLAKDLRAEEQDAPEAEDDTGGTVVGAVLGTPSYMPPEQARGEPVDERADVYALGAILYELLCGVAPYHEVSSGSTSARPVLEAVIDRPAVAVEARQAGVPRDLAAIVAKAMARAPADRYPTAKELAADLTRFQTGQLVGAHEYSSLALVQRWLLRNRLPVAISAVALVVLVAAGVVGVWRILHARRAAEAAQSLAEQRSAEAQAARTQVEVRKDELVLLQARALLDRDPTTSLAWLQQIPVTAPLWAEARAIAVEATSRGFARHVWRHARHPTTARFSPDGRFLVSCGMDEKVPVYDFVAGTTRTLTVPGRTAFDVAFAADGDLVTASDDGTILLWPAASLAGAHAEPRRIAAGAGNRPFITVSSDGRKIATAGWEATAVRVVDVATGAVQTLAGSTADARDILFSPDGQTLAMVSIDKVLHVWDPMHAAGRALASSDVTSRIVFAQGGAQVLAAELGGIREWTVATGASRVLPLPKQRYIAVAAAPDGATIAAAGFEGPVHLYDVASGEVMTLYGHEGMVTDLDFSPDGRLLVSAAQDHTVRVWQLPERRDRILGRVAGAAFFPTFAPDGAHVAAGASDGRVHIWDVASGAERVLSGHTKAVSDVAYAPDGAILASQGRDQTVRLWDLATGASRVVATTAPWTDFGRLVFSKDGHRLACSLDLDTLAILDVASGARVCTFAGHGFNLAHAFSPDSAEIAFTADHEVRLGELATCGSRPLYAHDVDKSAYAVVFSPDGRELASASDDGTIGLYDLGAGTLRRLTGHDMDVYAIAFAPDGRTLASGSFDKTVRLWDLATGAARELRGHELIVVQVLFAQGGRVVASTGLDHTIRLWDVASGAGSVLRGHHEKIQGIALSPDGTLLASGSNDGTVRLWPVDAKQDLPVDAAGIKAWLERVTTARIEGRGGLATSPPAPPRRY